MKILHLSPKGWQEDEQEALRKLGYEVVTEPEDGVDVIISKSVTQMKRSIEARKRCPDALTIEFNWDVYFWAITNPRKDEYDYKQYKALCLMSDEVWVPSKAVQITLKDEKVWGMDSYVMVSWCPQYPLPKDVKIKNGGYALQALRHNPDYNIDWYERACKETGIDYRITWAKEMEESAYRKLLAESGFLVAALYEMSTSGQFLSEGAAWGKPILASNSPYIGAWDYFGDTIAYYQHDDFEDLKRKIVAMSKGELKTDVKGAKKRILSMNVDWFAKKVHQRLRELL